MNYAELVEKAREIYESEDTPHVFKAWLLANIIYPADESEDEKIRKTLIELVKCNERSGYFSLNNIETSSIIAWLEKQKENLAEPKWCHHKVDLSNCSEEYRKAYYDGWNNCNIQHSQCKSEINDVIKCLIHGMKYHYEENEDAAWGAPKWNMPVKHIIEVLEKQGEQKSVDKVEPKFKVGDWVTNGHCRCKISFIDSCYWYSETCVLGDITSIDKTFHLWTIADAKDGDVLAFDDDTIVIFKDLYNATTFHSYCHIEDGLFGVNEDGSHRWEGEGFHPATKEQRELLFTKMKEAGYEWNAEKKEPKKIETTSKESEDEKNIKDLIDELKCSLRMAECQNYTCGGHEKRIALLEWGITWLKKQGKQKQTWKPNAAQLIVIKSLIEDKNTLNVSKVILRGMLDEFKQYF